MNRSPFPGMDPYLEASWGDIHHRFITYSCDQIQSQLPRDLRARTEERVSIGSPFHEDSRHIVPDVRVVERPHWSGGGGGVAVLEAPVGLVEPLLIDDDEPITEGFIQIVDTSSGQHVVTVIEVLSPTNKLAGGDREQFLRKRKALISGGVNIVEIDLLRSGRRLEPLDRRTLPPNYRTPYCVLIRRPGIGGFEYYRVPLRERLPKIPIPLRQTDRDVTLDLQAVFDLAYANGRYDDTDYSIDPNPPLADADAAWADALLRENGRRAAKS
ncbi:MAG: DUF4058 family protein [Planctomycetaceae bacterium]